MPHSLTAPAHAERIRCAIARHLVISHRYMNSLALAIAPKTHPWRTLSESTDQDLSELAYTTLRPRTRQGVVLPVIASVEPMKKRWAALKALLVTYLVLDILSARIHGPFDLIVQVDDAVRLLDRLGGLL